MIDDFVANPVELRRQALALGYDPAFKKGNYPGHTSQRALAIPGLGPFIAAGPIVATLSGLLGGAAVGGFAGSLIGLGIPVEEARRFEKHIRGGGALIAVPIDSKDEQLRAQQLLASIGASHVGVTPPSTREHRI